MANSKIKQILVGSTTYDIEDASAAHLATNNTFTGTNTFNKGITSKGSILIPFDSAGSNYIGIGDYEDSPNSPYGAFLSIDSENNGNLTLYNAANFSSVIRNSLVSNYYTYELPNKPGTFALTDDCITIIERTGITLPTKAASTTIALTDEEKALIVKDSSKVMFRINSSYVFYYSGAWGPTYRYDPVYPRSGDSYYIEVDQRTGSPCTMFITLQGVVTSNPALSGSETALTSISINGTSYKIGDVTAAGNNTFTGTNTFTQEPKFRSGILLGLTGVNPEGSPDLNDLWEISKEGFKAAGGSLSTQIIKFPDFSTFTTTNHTIPLNDTDNTFTGTNSFRGTSSFSHLVEIGDFYIQGGPTPNGKTKLRISYELGTTTMPYSDYGCVGITLHHPAASEPCELTFPWKSGTFALTSDLPDTSLFPTLAGNNTFTGTNTFNSTLTAKWGVTVESNGSASNKTTYDNGVIHVRNPSLFTTSYNFPYGSGTPGQAESKTVATLDDIDVKAAGNNTFTGSNTFSSGYLKVGNDSTNITLYDQEIDCGNLRLILDSPSSGTFNYKFPCKKNVDEAPVNIVTENEDNTFTGTNTFRSGNTKFTTPAAAAHDPYVKADASGIWCYYGANSDPAVDAFTSYNNGYIDYRVDAGAGTDRLTLPAYKSGTIALTSDIPIKTATLSGTTLSITLS